MKREKTVSVHLCGSHDCFHENTMRGCPLHMIPIKILIGDQLKSICTAHKLPEAGLVADVFGAFYVPGTGSVSMEAVLASVQRQPENPIRIYIDRASVAKNFQLQAAVALLTACLSTNHTPPTKSDRATAEMLKNLASPDEEPSPRSISTGSIVTGSLRSLFTWLLQEKYNEAWFVGTCLTTWFMRMSDPRQDSPNNRAERLIRDKNAPELIMHAIQHPFAEVPAGESA